MMMKAVKKPDFLGVSLPFLRPMPGPVRSVPPHDAAAIPHARVSIHVTFGFHRSIFDSICVLSARPVTLSFGEGRGEDYAA